MSYVATGMMALYSVYLPRKQKDTDDDAYDSAIAVNENNLNQNLELIYDKLMELERGLAAQQ